MFKKQKTEEGLQTVINQVTLEMQSYEPNSPEFNNMIDQLSKLYTLKNTRSSDRVSKDTMAIVVGNLAGIALIVGYEQAHVVTSKALNFILKAK